MRVISEPVTMMPAQSRTVNRGRDFDDEDDEVDDRPALAGTAPSNFSGPSHFMELATQCFSLQKGGFEYKLCPFHNATQKEISYGFGKKRYFGVIGIWLEWIVEDYHLAGFIMDNGDACANGTPRSTQVDFTCGDTYSLHDAREPKQCHYRMTFKLPQACHLDSLLVYPLLDAHQQEEWDLLEGAKLSNEITDKGHEAQLREILASSRLVLSASSLVALRETRISTPKNTPAHTVASAGDLVEKSGALLETTTVHSAEKHRRFASLQQCQSAYDLLEDAGKTPKRQV